jgi:hypothetical protein
MRARLSPRGKRRARARPVIVAAPAADPLALPGRPGAAGTDPAGWTAEPAPATGLLGGQTAMALAHPPDGGGRWTTTSAGRVLAFGDVPFLGVASARYPSGPTVAIAIDAR